MSQLWLLAPLQRGKEATIARPWPEFSPPSGEQGSHTFSSQG